MGRRYAGILGPLAMAAVIVRGVFAGAGVESTMLVATINLIAFAVVGMFVGTIAESVVDTAVRVKLETELAKDH